MLVSILPPNTFSIGVGTETKTNLEVLMTSDIECVDLLGLVSYILIFECNEKPEATAEPTKPFPIIPILYIYPIPLQVAPLGVQWW